uniref:Uncharacterized protein n=1 Tax=Anguilla anguilla TaxID=7936 RepID=A0A0E9WBT7_ANGAN
MYVYQMALNTVFCPPTGCHPFIKQQVYFGILGINFEVTPCGHLLTSKIYMVLSSLTFIRFLLLCYLN